MLIIVFLIASFAANCHPLPEGLAERSSENGLLFIGSRSFGVGTFAEESLYFTSQTPTKWDVAQHMCIEVLGNDASLVSIESASELDEIKILLQNGENPMTSFWSEGKYETGRQVFSWGRGEPVGSWIPWGENEPRRRDARTKIAFEKLNTGEWVSKAVEDTSLHGFICELVPGSASEPVPCFNTNDLILIMDSSGSIGASDYKKAIEEFSVPVANAWLGWPQTRLSFMIYSDDARSIFNLGSSLGERQKIQAIKDVPYLNSGTASHLALSEAFKEFDMFNRTVTRNVVFLTDGASNDRALTKEAAQNLHRGGVRCFSIGIGSGIISQELLDIAGGNQSHVFIEDDFARVKDLLKPITKLVCDD